MDIHYFIRNVIGELPGGENYGADIRQEDCGGFLFWLLTSFCLVRNIAIRKI